MRQPQIYDSFFYASHSLCIENLSLSVTLDGGMTEGGVTKTLPHSHPVFELQAVKSGALAIDFHDNETETLSAGEVMLLPPDLYHAVTPMPSAERLTLRFSCRKNTEEVGEELLSRFLALRGGVRLSDTAPILSLLESIRTEALMPGAASDALMRAYFSELFILLYRRLGEAAAADARPPLSENDDESARGYKIELLMNRHLSEPFSEPALAEALGLSVRQTSRVMQRIYGMSFRKKMSELRLHYAKGLLLTTDIPVERIAAEIGYTSPSGFHIAFRKAFGCTPGEYKDKYAAHRFKNGT